MDPTTESTSPPGPFRQLLPVALVLLLCLCLSTLLLYSAARSSVEQQAREYGQALGRSTAILVQPLLLADDRISLNYLFNELSEHPRVDGLQLMNPQGLTLAVAGEQEGLKQTLELARGDQLLGELSLWINPRISWQPTQQLLLQAGALALASIGLALATLALTLRRRRAAPQGTANFREVAAQVAPDLLPEAEDADSIPTLQPAAADRVEPTDAPLAPQVATWLQDSQAPAEPATDESPYPNIQPAPEAAVAERDDASDLVDLLRPSQDVEEMPPFTPSSYRDEEAEEAIAPEMDSVELEEEDAQEPSPPSRPSPLASTEEQLGLYTLEQELELMLSAEDAGYLFLIDASSARSENLNDEEHGRLMRPYRTLANSVAHIYDGRIETTEQGDLQLFFDTPRGDDGHGINALCGAMLFTHLYRHYNQHRIRQFKPVINLHLALVRGHHQKLERMVEEARFLTRTTESNELISHTALTEAPRIRTALLDGADIRREDEDKVLIIRLARASQQLLEKQARHLLSKLQQREQPPG